MTCSSDTPSTQDLLEFRSFCEDATPDQLREIARKEREAGRTTYANIAEDVRIERFLNKHNVK
tara:strand:+ start:114 stop:302 length:189 start_codon:yes stop_codon:yes gene_type:complete